MWHRQRFQVTSRGLAGSLMLAADRAGVDKTCSVFLQGGPPEPSLQDLFGVLNTWLTGELGAVGPLKDVRPQALRNKQVVMGTGTGPWLILQCVLYPLFHLPG